MALAEILLGSAMVAISVFIYFRKFRHFFMAEPDEWMIVMRNGKVIEMGIGISYTAGIHDVVVKFPSKINKVRFSAQQVTQEMQGIEVSGIIIWSIYRDRDGPLKAFKYLGEDIKAAEPTNANHQMAEISNAIVRHRIANSTIDEILKNRELVRDEIKKEMNAIVNGWGIWLESVEITDVKILSSNLFKDLQIEFRKEQQQKAELIKMGTERELKDRRVKQELDFAKKEADNETSKTICKLAEDLKMSVEKQKVYEEQSKIESKKAQTDTMQREFKEGKDKEFRLFEKAQGLDQFMKEADKRAEIKQQTNQIIQAQRKQNRFNVEAQIARERLQKDHEMENERKKLELENQVILQTSPRVRVLNVLSTIYSVLPIKEMKIFNFGEHKDPVAGLVGQVMGAVNDLAKGYPEHSQQSNQHHLNQQLPSRPSGLEGR
jgi:hypothetical protein